MQRVAALTPAARYAAKQFFLRAAVVYWIAWGLGWALLQISRLTSIERLAPRYWALWSPLTRLAGSVLFSRGEPAVYTDAGSGDSTFFWTLLVVQLAFAVVIGFCWFVFTRAKVTAALGALQTGLRYLLGAVLIEYGAAKVINVQFPLPRFQTLLTPVGQLPPEDLLWTFMGASPTYSLISGSVELLAGGLLLFRRTSVIGAILGFAAMLNVFLLNVSYDVPVKLFSAHLVLVAAWIIAPYARSIVGAAMPPRKPKGLERTWVAIAAPLLALAVFAGVSLRQNWTFLHTYGTAAPKPPLAGMYRVEEITSSTLEPPSAWHFAQLIVPDGRGPAQVWLPDGQVIRWRLEVDTGTHRVIVRPQAPSSARPGVEYPDTVHYKIAGDTLHVTGNLAGARIAARLSRIDASELPLLRQRLRWVR